MSRSGGAGRFPEGLKPGSRIRVISPSGPVDPDQLNLGRKVLEEWGFKVEIAPHALSRKGYLAGADEERLADLSGALLDPRVSAVICSRGGYGVMRLLGSVPWGEIAALPPKPFVGFSDLGAFQLPLWSRCGWVSYSGPQVAMGLGGDVTPRTAAHLRGMLTGDHRSIDWQDGERVRLEPVRGGQARGVMIPCCLSVLVSLIGTEWIPELGGVVLCLEDIGEPPYRIDRMLWQLCASGMVNGIAALVLGRFTWNEEEVTQKVVGIASEIFERADFPIWGGLLYGHVDDRLTLPLGAAVTIDGEGYLHLDEAATADDL